MNKHILFSIFGMLLFSRMLAQEPDYSQKIRSKVQDGFSYIYQQAQDNPKDIVIVKTNTPSQFFLVLDTGSNKIKAREVCLPDHTVYKDEILFICPDSVLDVFWIRKKNFQNLRTTDFKQPFKHLKGRFFSESIETIQKLISVYEQKEKEYYKNIEVQAYYTQIKEKYDSLEFYNFSTLNESILKGTNSGLYISTYIIYPQLARESGTQGVVRIGYVLTKDCEAVDFFILKGLGDGCTEAVIEAIKNLTSKLKIQNVSCRKNMYFEGDVRFILN